ncbi:hypothetical protein KDRO_C00270 [Kluyveromyces lactis]|nr:hypothetical protein KDRO_C00270 [Kluyveromyces lactis]
MSKPENAHNDEHELLPVKEEPVPPYSEGGELGRDFSSNIILHSLRANKTCFNMVKIITVVVCLLYGLALYGSDIGFALFAMFMTTVVGFLILVIPVAHAYERNTEPSSSVFKDIGNALFFLKTIHDFKPSYIDMNQWDIVARIVNKHLYEAGSWPNNRFFYDGKRCQAMFIALVKKPTDPLLEDYIAKANETLKTSMDELWNSTASSSV